MGSSTLERVKKHRAALRAAGLRPVQIWVPDTRRPGFAEECWRQSLALRGDEHELETLDWLAAAADTSGWESQSEEPKGSHEQVLRQAQDER